MFIKPLEPLGQSDKSSNADLGDKDQVEEKYEHVKISIANDIPVKTSIASPTKNENGSSQTHVPS